MGSDPPRVSVKIARVTATGVPPVIKRKGRLSSQRGSKKNVEGIGELAECTKGRWPTDGLAFNIFGHYGLGEIADCTVMT